ncbi:MAG: VWA domain-containing protein [Clostridiales bacterium]|nr:VWA domain-containing protein [Clostridiales bacterium]
MNNISLDNPYLLLIAVPLIVLFTVGFAIAVRKTNRNGHNIASYVMHVAMAIIVAFAAASPTVVTVLTETEVYVVADVSYSANRNLGTIDRYIKDLTDSDNLPGNTKLGLVCFGKEPQLVSPLGDPDKVASVKKARVDDSETNIAEALEFTGGLFGNGTIKRVVLITDGKQSDLSDDDAIRRAVDGLFDKGIRVDAIFLDNNPSPNSKEVQISGVDVTDTVYLDSVQTAVLEVESSYDTTATVHVKRNGVSLPAVAAELTVGRNGVNLALDTSVAGTFDYEVSIVAEKDLNLKNNTYSFTQTVSDEMRMLVVTHSFDDVMAAVTRYGDKGELDIYENDAEFSPTLKDVYVSRQAGKSNIKFHLATNDVPYTIDALCKYDQIVLADVDIGKLTNSTAFISNLDTAVAVLGKSLITFGNLHIQNVDDESAGRLEDMLPVKFGNNDSKLYTFIIDTSRSMNQLDHLNLTKQLVKRMLNTLPDNTYVTIITFNSDAEVIQLVAPLSNREEMIEKVENFDVIQGTVLGSGLARTLEYIAPLNFDDKQVLLITDGLSYSVNVEDDPIDVAEKMYAAGIVTSVFDVGRQGDRPDGSNPYDSNYAAAYELLTRVAQAGHGHHYYSNNLERLDEVTFGEMADDLTLTVVERETTVSVQRLHQKDPVLDGLSDADKLNLPTVMGYVYCGSKPSATTVLSVNHKRHEDSTATTEKPLYAYQNYGKGMVSSFTSALGGSWIGGWSGDVGGLFFGNMFDVSIPKEKVSEPYSVEVIREGTVTRIEVLPTMLQAGAKAKIEITPPNGEPTSYDMLYNGGLYYYEFDTAAVGKYDVNITYTYRETCSSKKTVYVCYLDEYDAFSVYEPSALYRAIGMRGTVSKNGRLKIENDKKDVGRYVVDLTVPLMIAAVALFVIDIIVRKLKWDDVKSFFGFGKKRRVKND